MVMNIYPANLRRLAIIYFLLEIHSIHTINMSQKVIQPIIKEVYGLTVLYRHIYVVKGAILSHFKVTLKTIAKVNKLDAGSPSCAQPPKPFLIVSMQYSQH